MKIRLPKRLREFLTDQSGPAAVEYAVMLALIATSLGGAAAVVGARAGLIFQQTADGLEVPQSSTGQGGDPGASGGDQGSGSGQDSAGGSGGNGSGKGGNGGGESGGKSAGAGQGRRR